MSKVFSDVNGLVPAGFGDSAARVSDRKGISGNSRPAIEDSAARRPVLGRGPVAGRRNLFTRSGQQNIWESYSVTREATPELNAFGDHFTKVTYLGGTSRVRRSPDGGVIAGRTYAFSMVCKADTTHFATFGIAGGPARGIVFDLASGTVAEPGSGQWLDPSQTSISHLSNGEYRCTFVFTPDIDSMNALGFTDAGVSNETYPHEDKSVLISSAQLEEGNSATPYQRIGETAFDITEPILNLSLPSYLRFDLSDDRMQHEFPAGFQGDVMIFGRDGSWIEEGVTIAPSDKLDIGPHAIADGIPGIIEACGDIVGWLPVGRDLSQQERQYMVDYYKERGAKGLLVPGPEIVPNFDLKDGLSSGWDILIPDDWEFVNGRIVLPESDPSASASAAGATVPLVSSSNYFYRAKTNRTIGRRNLGGNTTNVRVRETYLETGGVLSEGISKPLGSANEVRVRPTNIIAGDYIEFLSVRELRPEEEW